MIKLIEIDRPGYNASITRTKNGFILAWFDGIANAWQEPYSDLSIAIARLAVLEHCSVTDRNFAHDVANFEPAAQTFISSATR